MPEIYGPKKRFSTREAAERFVRHLTRELTAGGIPHWVEVHEPSPGRFVATVHQFDCEGAGSTCTCGKP